MGDRYHSIGDDQWTRPLVWDAEMIYLASPYSNDPESNYTAMLDVCKRLVSRAPAPLVFSPVVYFHTFAQHISYHALMGLCFEMLKVADELIIVDLPGWTESFGVSEECRYWKFVKAKPFKLMDHKSLLVIPQ